MIRLADRISPNILSFWPKCRSLVNPYAELSNTLTSIGVTLSNLERANMLRKIYSKFNIGWFATFANGDYHNYLRTLGQLCGIWSSNIERSRGEKNRQKSTQIDITYKSKSRQSESHSTKIILFRRQLLAFWSPFPVKICRKMEKILKIY